MSNYQQIFKRYEKKYLLNEGQYDALLFILRNYMSKDDYGKHTICNIYFDTEDYQLIRSSIEKPVYKEKLRLRSYGVPKKDDMVFIELKKKFKKVVYKRRIAVPLYEAEAYLYNRKPLAKETQISREIDWFMNFYQPIPKVYLAYDRLAFFGKENADLRITFDTNIRWRTEWLSLSAGDFGQVMLDDKIHLMEVKIPNAMPVWLSHIFDQLEIFPVSYSKYGNCYKNYLSTMFWEGSVHCA